MRSKLDEYYANDGANDPILISFQRGDYIPRFIHVPSKTDRLSEPKKPASVLIVEDEKLVAKDLEQRLRSMGYAVLGSAPSGEAAIESVESLHPDLVLMDIVLAGPMRGTDAARQIWQRWQIPVVYLTAFSDAVVLEDIKGTEPYGYILKPFEPKQVHAILQLALSRRAKIGAESPSSALEGARLGTWEWTITDDQLAWPASAAAGAENFLDGIHADDRERVIETFTHGIRERGRIEVAYRKATEAGENGWVVGKGTVQQDPSGQLRCTGVEINMQAGLAPEHDFKAYPQLLTYTLLSRERPTAELVSLDSALDAALENLESEVRDATAQIDRPLLPSVLASQSQVTLLFQNLIGNAIKYRKPDVSPVIRISARNANGFWRISVQDNGPGFEMPYRDQIFEPFKRLPNERGEGTGLGLAICRRIVESYGGRIWAESEPGTGSVFHFTLPGVPGLCPTVS